MVKRAIALLVVVACGRGGSTAPAEHRDAMVGQDAAAVVLPTRMLGMPELAGFAYRKRAGQPAFRIARKAEDREDWPAVVTACRDALAADPGHLEASWLLAIALAKTGKLADVLEPLSNAVAGDFGKWATASLEHPALQPFLATPTGQAWRRRIDDQRAGYVAAVARSLAIVAAGEIYAYDAVAPRWYRLTRTFGAVVATFAIPAAHRIAYVTRQHVRAGGKRELHLAVGVVDLATGHTSKPVDVGVVAPQAVAYSAAKPAGVWLGSGPVWRQLDDDGKLHALPPKTTRPPGAWLELTGHTARLHRLPVAAITADWNDQSLASAIRIGTSNRVVSVPSPGLIDGNTAAWSPDRAHVAFVAQLDDHCTPGAISAAAFVADGASGTVRELERAAGGLAVEWLGDGRLAIAGDRGVSIGELGGGSPVLLGASTELVAPRRKPRCTPEPAESAEPAEEEPTGDEPSDAGVGPAR